MTIWSRITASLDALTHGEPLSAVFERLVRAPEHTVAFTIATIALGAKMAKADGRVTIEEISAFRQVFHIAPEDEARAAQVFDLARQDVAGFETYSAQIARMFTGRPEMLLDLLEGLVFVAAADGSFHADESAYLGRVAQIFGVGEPCLRAIRARHVRGEHDPYAVLGLDCRVSAADLRARYRALVRELHPDPMIARGVPIEARRLAEARLAAVTEAYAQILGERAAPL